MKTKFVQAIGVALLMVLVLSPLLNSRTAKAPELSEVAAVYTADPKPGHTG
jgi:hypothetical protein